MIVFFRLFYEKTLGFYGTNGQKTTKKAPGDEKDGDINVAMRWGNYWYWFVKNGFFQC